MYVLGTGDSEQQNPIQFMINILKVEGEDKHCVEGVILKGDTFEFTEVFKQMKAFFGGHANASESS